MEVDRRVLRRYEVFDEDARLWSGSRGELVRLRTWDILHRHLPPEGRVLDVGGGPGTHAAHLAGLGYAVTLVDPAPNHLDRARRRSGADGRGSAVESGDARALPHGDGSFDVVLLMGPLYHLPEPADRSRALGEARRVLRPGGTIVAEVITRHAWVLGACLDPRRLVEERIWEVFDTNITTGLSETPDHLDDGGFWAYFHGVDELEAEVSAAGFDDIRLLGVEGHAWLLGSLDEHLSDPAPLLRALRLVEQERTLLGTSAHVMAIATKSGNPDD